MAILNKKAQNGLKTKPKKTIGKGKKSYSVPSNEPYSTPKSNLKSSNKSKGTISDESRNQMKEMAAKDRSAKQDTADKAIIAKKKKKNYGGIMPFKKKK